MFKLYRLIGDPMPLNTLDKTRLKIEIIGQRRYFQGEGLKFLRLIPVKEDIGVNYGNFLNVICS